MNTSEITNNLIDKIVAMYVPDGNPEIFLKKIIALKEPSSKYKIGEKLIFNVGGYIVEGNFIKMVNDNVINIEVIYDEHDDDRLTRNVHESYLIK